MSYPEPGSLLDPMLQTLAREIVADVYPLDDILRRLEVSQTQWETIKESPIFTELVLEASREAMSAKGTVARLERKALVSLEMSLPEMYRAANDAKEPLNHRTEMLKLLAKLARLGEAQPTVSTGGSGVPSIRIYLGGASPTVIEGTAERVEPNVPVLDVG